MPPDRRQAALLLGAFVLGISGLAGQSWAEPLSVRDAYGRVITLHAAPERIIPIYPSNVELVVALGLSDRIVGIEGSTRYPPEILNRPSIGGRLGFRLTRRPRWSRI